MRQMNVAEDLVKGAVAGAVATWVMGRVTTSLYENESPEVRQQEDRARADKSATEIAAERLAAVANVELSDQQRQQAGLAIHWAVGAGAGAAYAVIRKRWPAIARLKGLPFGAGFFLIVDETLNPVLGLTPGPQAFPWQAHARGLAGHLAFGMMSEVVLDGLDRAA